MNYRYVIIGQEYQVLNESLVVNEAFSATKYSYITRPTGNVVAFYPQDISKKCILVPLDNEKVILFEIVNAFETD